MFGLTLHYNDFNLRLKAFAFFFDGENDILLVKFTLAKIGQSVKLAHGVIVDSQVEAIAVVRVHGRIVTVSLCDELRRRSVD